MSSKYIYQGKVVRLTGRVAKRLIDGGTPHPIHDVLYEIQFDDPKLIDIIKWTRWVKKNELFTIDQRSSTQPVQSDDTAPDDSDDSNNEHDTTEYTTVDKDKQ